MFGMLVGRLEAKTTDAIAIMEETFLHDDIRLFRQAGRSSPFSSFSHALRLNRSPTMARYAS